MNRMFHSPGFTLIELMLVVAVLAVIVALATPSLETLLHSNRLRIQSSQLMTALNLARSEAISRNSPVSLCPSSLVLSGAPICSGIYADGWIVFSNRDRDRVVDAGIDDVIRAYEGLPRGYSLTNKSGTLAASELISYLPDGSSRLVARVVAHFASQVFGEGKGEGWIQPVDAQAGRNTGPLADHIRRALEG